MRGMWSGDVRRSRFSDDDCREPVSLWPRNDRCRCCCDVDGAISRGRSITPGSFASTAVSLLSDKCTVGSPVTIRLYFWCPSSTVRCNGEYKCKSHWSKINAYNLVCLLTESEQITRQVRQYNWHKPAIRIPNSFSTGHRFHSVSTGRVKK